MTLDARDIPFDAEFVAQTRSTREVEIRTRVAGFLEKRLYKEGDLVRGGQVMFQIDRGPFEAALTAARAQLVQQRSRFQLAKAELARMRSLVERNAMSKKDLDDAISVVRSAHVAVMAAQGWVETARLNLEYTTIASPLAGLSSHARKPERSYVAPGAEALLATVSALDPIEVTFSVPENELLRWREERVKGRLRTPPGDDYEVELTLPDGSVLPHHGRIIFADPSFRPQTRTLLLRTEVANPGNALRPGQFVRVKLKGGIRPNAIVVPQRAIVHGPKSHFVWVIDKEGKAEERAVEAGDWIGNQWVVNSGLKAGERIVVDGAIRVIGGAQLNVTDSLSLSEGANRALR